MVTSLVALQPNCGPVISVSKDGRRIASASPEEVRIWSEDGEPLHIVDVSRFLPHSASLNHDGSLVALSGEDGYGVASIRDGIVWHLEEKPTVGLLEPQWLSTDCVCFTRRFAGEGVEERRFYSSRGAEIKAKAGAALAREPELEWSYGGDTLLRRDGRAKVVASWPLDKFRLEHHHPDVILTGPETCLIAGEVAATTWLIEFDFIRGKIVKEVNLRTKAGIHNLHKTLVHGDQVWLSGKDREGYRTREGVDVVPEGRLFVFDLRREKVLSRFNFLPIFGSHHILTDRRLIVYSFANVDDSRYELKIWDTTGMPKKPPKPVSSVGCWPSRLQAGAVVQNELAVGAGKMLRVGDVGKPPRSWRSRKMGFAIEDILPSPMPPHFALLGGRTPAGAARTCLMSWGPPERREQLQSSQWYPTGNATFGARCIIAGGHLYDEHGKLLRKDAYGRYATCVGTTREIVSPDGSELVVHSPRGKVRTRIPLPRRVKGSPSDRYVREFDMPDEEEVNATAGAAEAATFVCGTSHGRVFVWSDLASAPVEPSSRKLLGCEGIGVSSDGERIALSDGAEVVVLSREGRVIAHRPMGGPRQMSTRPTSMLSRSMVMTAESNGLCFWNVDEDTRLHLFVDEDGEFFAVRNDGEFDVSEGWQARVCRSEEGTLRPARPDERTPGLLAAFLDRGKVFKAPAGASLQGQKPSPVRARASEQRQRT